MWNLYEKDKFLEPLCFSNGKSQADIVKEVLDAVKEGHKVIFIQGVCGTGKSAIALNIARKLGKASVVVPGKNLQAQYKADYEGNKYLLKNSGEKLKISVITGRNNHRCKFLEDNKNSIPFIKKEVNSNLNNIFEGKREEVKELVGKDISADNWNIPCKIELKEKNWAKIKGYLKQNKNVDITSFNEARDVRRLPVASVCPYWSPVIPEEYEIKVFENIKKKSYTGIGGKKFSFYPRKEGCAFYEQFNSYVESDVIAFNSLKYKLESALGRKPQTDVEIIDECDEFLDSFSNQKNINIDRLQNSLIHAISFDENVLEVIDEISALVKKIKNDKRIEEAIYSDAIIPLKETPFYDLFKIFMQNPDFLNEIDNESYLFDVEETVRMFDEFLEDTYITFNKKDNQLVASVVTTNLAKRFNEMVEKNKIIVLMSGTVHSENVLKNIFGINSYKIIEAETSQQGQIEVVKMGLEKDCKYANFSSGHHTKKDYLKALDKCLEIAKKPILVHVNAFTDLPSEKDILEFGLKNLISKEKLKEMQKEDKTGEMIKAFKEGGIDILFSTRSSRGVDFPGEQCNSIVFTKYPNPNVQDAFWRILMKTKPQHYWDFYKDKARRELWQRVYRGIRFNKDHVYVLSPDSRVLDVFEDSKL